MMCEITENKKNKCHNYWPSTFENDDQLVLLNGLSLRLVYEQNIYNNLTKRNFILSNSNSNEERKIDQFHFRKWPDHGVPDINDSFNTFDFIINGLDEHYKNFKDKSPVVVHCSAGVGRTGTIISLFSLHYIYKIYFEQKTEIMKFNIFNIVRQLKEQRRYMVQTDSQYKMIYDWFAILFLKKFSKK